MAEKMTYRKSMALGVDVKTCRHETTCSTVLCEVLGDWASSSRADPRP